MAIALVMACEKRLDSGAGGNNTAADQSVNLLRISSERPRYDLTL
jgi:hypothetical protein